MACGMVWRFEGHFPVMAMDPRPRERSFRQRREGRQPAKESPFTPLQEGCHRQERCCSQWEGGSAVQALGGGASFICLSKDKGGVAPSCRVTSFYSGLQCPRTWGFPCHPAERGSPSPPALPHSLSCSVLLFSTCHPLARLWSAPVKRGHTQAAFSCVASHGAATWQLCAQ